jgi:hypothetical protein
MQRFQEPNAQKENLLHFDQNSEHMFDNAAQAGEPDDDAQPNAHASAVRAEGIWIAFLLTTDAVLPCMVATMNRTTTMLRR